MKTSLASLILLGYLTGANAQDISSIFPVTITANDDAISPQENLTLRGGGNGVPIKNYFVGNNDNPAGTVVTIGSGTGAVTNVNGALNTTGDTTVNGLLMGTAGSSFFVTDSAGGSSGGTVGPFSSSIDYTTSTGQRSVIRAFGGAVESTVRNSGGTVISGFTSNGVANTLTGQTFSAGIANTGNITTNTLNTTGNAALGSLAVSGASTTNGITNSGNIATGTLTASGNTAVGGNLAVAGTSSTNGINNNGQVISNVAPGVAPGDAANVGQVNAATAGQSVVNNNQAAINNSQAGINNRLQTDTYENRRLASTGTAIVSAAAAIPALEGGKKMGLGAGVGTYDGRSAVAIGFAARISQALQIKLHVGTGSGGKVAAGAGGIWSW